jgi:hypothetical protein
MRLVRRDLKTVVVALAVLVLSVGVSACGGGDDSSSTTTEAASPAAPQSTDGATRQRKAKKGAEGDSGGGSRASGEASEFVPKPHHDSGGGSTQFKTKGGDNSVQEFGAEGDSAERKAAATALHDFLDARAEQNWAAACEHLSKTVTESFEKLAEEAKHPGASCAVLLEQLTNPAAKASMKAEAENADVRSLRLEGERGFVIYTVPDGTVYTMPMVNEGGEWKVSTVAGTPIG